MQPAPVSTRFVFVDGLRGLAALSVVLFHVYYKNLVPMTGYEFPEPVHSLLRNGNLGVHVFFVISGFVIAQSIRGEHVTARFVGWFALRRSLRLDPPYWATIAAMIALTFVSNHLQHDRSLPMPTPAAVLAHLAYAQSFLGYPQIVGVFWTLCFEIQFYLVLVVGTGAVQRLERVTRFPVARWLVFAPLWLLGLGCVAGYIDLPPALFTFAWPYFFLGVVVNWAHERTIGPVALALVAASALVLVPSAPLQICVALATALGIDLVGRAGGLATVTLGPVVQYLGKISYSLYLVHMLVGTPLVRLGIRLLGTRPDAIRAIGLMAIATAASIVAAHVMYVVIERPAIGLSRRLGRHAPRAVGRPA